MEICALGTGSAFSLKNYQSNFLITRNGKRLLIDCGQDVRHALNDIGLTYKDIDAVYVSHLHADHVGSMEWLGFCKLFDPNEDRPTLYVEGGLSYDLWRFLEPTMRGLEGRKYNGDGVTMETYFDTIRVSKNGGFVWQGINFEIVQTVHITAKYSIENSFGLIFTDPDTDKRIYITTDTQFSPEATMKALYDEADIIIHDCETTPFKSGVHANYMDLKTLSPEHKAKMWLYHYQDNIIDNWESANRDAINDGFRGYLPTRAIFTDNYDAYDSGTVGHCKIPIFNDNQVGSKVNAETVEE
jgi:ribonuclease BN (tRNA processing enzyme)